MMNHSGLQSVNPNLKTSFSTFTSAILASFILLAIFERLGVDAIWLGYLMISVPVAAYAIIGILSRSVLLSEYYVSGRRVPAFYNGMALAVSAMGGVGFFALTGTFVSSGYDALPFLLGMAGGFVLMAILFAPYLRKFGAYTMASFLAERYQSPMLRIVTAVLLIVPSFILVTTELRIGAEILSQFTPASYGTLVFLCASILVISILPGGMRGLTWTQCAQYIVVLLGFITPLMILSVQYTNLPLPQLTYGSLLDSITELEAVNGAVNQPRTGTLSDYVARSSVSLEKSFSQLFGKLSPAEFIALTVAIMLGISIMPSLLMRSNLSPGVADMRTTMSWALLLLGIMLASIPAFAVFMKYLTMKAIIGQQYIHLPGWVKDLQLAGLISLEDLNRDGIVGLRELTLARDGIPLILPIVGELPFVLVGLIAAAGVSAALAAAGAHTLVITHAISNDIISAFILPGASKTRQLVITRLFLLCTIALGIFFTLQRSLDILQLTLASLNLAACTFFPAILLSIWYKRSTSTGVILAMISGFILCITSGYLMEITNFDSLLGINVFSSAVVIVPLSITLAILVSRFYPAPDKEIAEITNNLRVPRGETLYDRGIRLSTRKK